MAKRKKLRNKYTSKGSGASVSKSISKAVKKDRTLLETVGLKMDAWKKGKKVNSFNGIEFSGSAKRRFKLPSAVADAD